MNDQFKQHYLRFNDFGKSISMFITSKAAMSMSMPIIDEMLGKVRPNSP